MKTSKKILASLTVVSVFGIVLSFPYSVRFDTETAAAQIVSQKRNLVFFHETNAESELDYVMHVPKEQDNAFEKIREHLKLGKVKVSAKKFDNLPDNWTGVTDVAFYVEDVRINDSLKQAARQALASGVKVYLYGESLLIDEYEKLMGVEKISAEVYFAGKAGEVQEKTGVKPELIANDDLSYQVIGYTADNTQPNQYFLGEIQGVASPRAFKGHMFMQQILLNMIDTNERMENPKKNNRNLVSGFLSKKKAYAESTRIQLGPNQTTSRYRNDGKLAGQITSSYELYRDLSETDITYDFISVQDVIQTMTYNDTINSYLSVYHKVAVPTADDLHDWGPSSTSISWNMTVTIPWGLEWQISNASAISIEDQSDKSLDQGAWWVAGEYGSEFGDAAVFKPGISVFSKGTFATLNLNRTAYFRHSYPIDGKWYSTEYSAVQNRNISYDY